MPGKPSKCDAEVCLGASGSRSPRVRCEFCCKSIHIRCADVPSTIVKTLRDSPGICWLCIKCRNTDHRKSTSQPLNESLALILQRTTSSLKLVGALVDSMQLFCRMYSQSFTQASCSANLRINNANQDAGQLFNEEPLNFTKVFESIIGDKRPRTSSVSHQSMSQPDKIAKVDFPVTQLLATSTTDSILSDPAANADHDESIRDAALLAGVVAATEQATAAAIGQISDCTAHVAQQAALQHAADQQAATLLAAAQLAAAQNVVAAVPQRNAPALAQLTAAQQIAEQAALLHTTATVSQHGAAAFDPSTRGATEASQPAAAHATQSAAAAASQPAATDASQRAAVDAFQLAVDQSATNAAQATPTTQATATTQAITTTLQPSATTIQPLAVATSTQPPSILVPAAPQRWFHVSPFLPHESLENIVSYIKKLTNCDPSTIICKKLVGDNGSRRALTFVSFKLCMPESIETIVTAENFWPAGVTIKPFLEDRSPAPFKRRTRPVARPQSPAIPSPRIKRTAAPQAPRPQYYQPNRNNLPLPPFLPQFIQPTMIPQYQFAPQFHPNLAAQRFWPST